MSSGRSGGERAAGKHRDRHRAGLHGPTAILHTMIRSLGLFVLAGLCEIGGGYLVWLWLREHRPLWVGIAGGLILAAYGAVIAVAGMLVIMYAPRT